MAIAATQTTALLTGIASGFVLWFVGPTMDQSQGLVGTVLLIGGALLVGVPAYFFVFGSTRSEMEGLWLLRPELLKRVGACFLGAASTVALFSLLRYAF